MRLRLIAVATCAQGLRPSTRRRVATMATAAEDAAADARDAIRACDSATLLAECARRGLAPDDAKPPKPPRSSHVVGGPRAASENSAAREADLRKALAALGVDADDVAAGPPAKAFATFCRPRDLTNAKGRRPARSTACCTVFGAGRSAAAGRDVDIPRATERTKIDGL